MLAAVKGIVKGNTVVIDDEDIRDYDGAEVIVTLLNYPQRKAKKAPVDWDSFVIPSEKLHKFASSYGPKILIGVGLIAGCVYIGKAIGKQWSF